MATTQDILTTPYSGYNHIDALLAAGPDWNFLTSNGITYRTTLYYSFAVDGPQYEGGVQVFNAVQQQATQQILAYVAQITGITFAQASNAAAADLHFAAANLANADLGGVSYAAYGYTGAGNGLLTSYTADATIYLDSKLAANQTPVAGTWGYQALLHEIGHALGLKHPFEVTADAPRTLDPSYRDDTSHTVMSYTHTASGYYSQFNEYDLAALNYLYGGDGLRGALGVGANGLYLTGSSLDDSFILPHGQVILVDMGGNDTAGYADLRGDYTIEVSSDKAWLHILGTGIDHLISSSVEQLSFRDGVVATATLLHPAGGGDIPNEPPPDPDTGGEPPPGPQPIQSIAGVAFGSDNADLLIGTTGNDVYSAFAGNDTLMVNGGEDLLFGGLGLDTAVFNINLQDALLTNTGANWKVNYQEGLTTLNSIERLQFLDGNVALDLGTSQSAGQAALVVVAAGGAERLADQALMGELVELFDNGGSIQQAGAVLTGSDWFIAASGGTDAGFVDMLFENVMGVAPAAAEQNLFLGMLAGHGGSMSQAGLLAMAAISTENQDAVNLAGLQQTGLLYL